MDKDEHELILKRRMRRWYDRLLETGAVPVLVIAYIPEGQMCKGFVLGDDALKHCQETAGFLTDALRIAIEQMGITEECSFCEGSRCMKGPRIVTWRMSDRPCPICRGVGKVAPREAVAPKEEGF